MDVVVPPETLVEAGGKLRLHGLYYIAKQINPALERVFGLLGADVRAWFAQLPRPSRLLPQKRPPPALLGEASAGGGASTGTIDRYYLSRHCAICDQLTAAASAICERCAAEPSLAAGVLLARQARLDARYRRLVRLCTHCGGDGGWSRAHDGAVGWRVLIEGMLFVVHRKCAFAVFSRVSTKNGCFVLNDQQCVILDII